MNFAVPASLAITGFIHLLPLSGAFGRSKLQQLYGLKFEDPSLFVLMTHRSVMFGLYGSMCWYSIYQPVYRPLALLGGLISAGSFLVIANQTGGDYNDKVARVVMADIVAVGALVIGTGVYLMEEYL
mmetsp:Transcript_2474/g.4497  ORF Transcript_2474/g.4497 Transcript_2474/m.4497 type:complete len:127 (+) Transcript_2474:27-407(+)